jgi:putative transposase
VARLPRLAAPGHVHLLMQRGNSGRLVFEDDDDRGRYLHLLREAALAARVAIHAYALADCEVLLLATPDDATGLSRMMQALGRRYVSGFNRRHGRSGTLWDGRFRATVIEAEVLLQACTCFVELAPVRAGSVAAAQDWRWSSARHHLGLAADPLVSDHPLSWAIGNTPFEREAAHQRLLDQGLGAIQARDIADAVSKGWALGSAPFAGRLAERVGRRVVPGRRGRPRGKQKALAANL